MIFAFCQNSQNLQSLQNGGPSPTRGVQTETANETEAEAEAETETEGETATGIATDFEAFDFEPVREIHILQSSKSSKSRPALIPRGERRHFEFEGFEDFEDFEDLEDFPAGSPFQKRARI